MRKLFFAISLLLFLAISAWSQSATVTVKNAKLRGTPNDQAKTVDKLDQFSRVRILATEREWNLVQSAEYAGWIRSDELRADPPPPPARAAASTATPAVTRYEHVPETPVSSETVKDPTGSCKDGTVTYAETKTGACADHGGVAEWFSDADQSATTSSSSTPATSSGGTVNVKGYYRKDGTYVRPHTRSAPRRRP